MTIQIGQGNQHDSQVFDSLIEFDKPPLAIVADKAYDSAHIRQMIADEGALAVIPSKSNAKTRLNTTGHFTECAILWSVSFVD